MGKEEKENGEREGESGKEGTGRCARGRLFNILHSSLAPNAGKEEPVPEQPDPAAARPSGLNSAIEPPGGGATL